MLPKHAIRFKKHGDNNYVAMVLCGMVGQQNNTPVFLSMSGDTRDEALANLQSYAADLWESLRGKAESQLGQAVKLQRAFLARYFRST